MSRAPSVDGGGVDGVPPLPLFSGPEQSVVVLKPDGEDNEAEILDVLTQAGYAVIKQQRMKLSKQRSTELYELHTAVEGGEGDGNEEGGATGRSRGTGTGTGTARSKATGTARTGTAKSTT